MSADEVKLLQGAEDSDRLERKTNPGLDPTDITFKGNARTEHATLLDFWQWAFSDLRDDDIKGIFAEWMVGTLLHLPLSRRVSWADSDLLLPDGTGVEVKATALWQSWKLVNPDGTPKHISGPATLDPNRIRFGGLQSRSAEIVAKAQEQRRFKSRLYVFCLHNQADPTAWDASNLEQWEFYVMSSIELERLKVGSSISLAALRRVRPPMSAAQFQETCGSCYNSESKLSVHLNSGRRLRITSLSSKPSTRQNCLASGRLHNVLL